MLHVYGDSIDRGPLHSGFLNGLIGDAHRRYSGRVNFREGWRGHLFQGRFASFAMDEAHVLAAAGYVEMNPVRAGLAEAPWEWKWSSAGAHLEGRDDKLAKAGPLLQLVGGWEEFLGGALSEEECETFRRHERTGRPLGSAAFVERIERDLGRVLRPRKAGRKPKTDTAE